jgi:hypothetical protein
MYRTFIVALLIPTLAAAQEKPPAEIVKLIEQLDSKLFREREQATRKLLALDDVPPELDAATRSPSPERARRAALIVDQIQLRNQEKRLQRELARINQTGVDFFLDRMVLQKDFATAARWRTVADLADVLAMSANKLGYAGCVVPKAKWNDLPLVTDALRRTERLARAAIDGQNVRAQTMDCLVISSGTIGRMGSVRNSILFIDGDFDGANYLQNSVLVCTGAVGPIQTVMGSIVLTPGKFGTSTTVRNSFFQTAGVGSTRSADGNTFVNLKQVDGADAASNKFVPSDSGPLSLVKWFDPAALGLKLTHANGEAKVDGLTAGKPLAKSGLQAGDVIQLIDGRGWVDADQFVRDLRRALARDAATLRVKRGGKTEDIPIHLAE